MKHPIIFRKWKDRDGGIIGLCLTVPATADGKMLSYQLGNPSISALQSGAAEYEIVMQRTVPATAEEYAELRKRIDSERAMTSLPPIRVVLSSNDDFRRVFASTLELIQD